ncbi:hypothetical protein BsWGS_24604 [Bradybaena similaris]
MPRATITSRQLKNKDTGLDLIVSSYRETKGLMSSTVYYQVVLVSNLACFKTPSHKESDVVQYSIEKQWSEFEELRVKVAGLFHEISLPALNKISIIVNEQVLRHRRNNLDQLVKFMASVPRLAACVPLLEFLGVDAGRAKRFAQGEPLERSTSKPASDGASEGGTEAQDSEADVFEDDVNDQPDGNLFDEDIDDADEALFGNESVRAQVSMFEQQDLKADLTEEDEKDFRFIPDAIITKREIIQVVSDDTEASPDLLIIEDDLDKLMTIDVSKHETQLQQKGEELLLAQSPPSVVAPNTPARPSPAQKPAAKQSIVNKLDDFNLPQGQAAAKPPVAGKPKPAQKPQSSVGQTSAKLQSSVGQTSAKLQSSVGSQQSSSDNSTVSHDAALTEKSTKSASVDTFDQEDILKYLHENSSTADDTDLFS